MKTLIMLALIVCAVPAWAAEKVAIHNARTGQIVVRDRTTTEQIRVDSGRAQAIPKRQPTVEDVIKALEKKLLLTRQDVLAEIQ